MSFVEFLSSNYVWILILLGIAIVTVIGFLADKKKKGKKQAKQEEVVENINNQMPPANTANNDSLGVNNVNANVVSPSATQMPTSNVDSMGNNMMNGPVNVSPTINPNGMPSQQVMANNIDPNVNANNNVNPVMGQMPQAINPEVPSPIAPVPAEKQEDYKPLSEQKPNIQPRVVEMPKDVPNTVSSGLDALSQIRPVMGNEPSQPVNAPNSVMGQGMPQNYGQPQNVNPNVVNNMQPNGVAAYPNGAVSNPAYGNQTNWGNMPNINNGMNNGGSMIPNNMPYQGQAVPNQSVNPNDMVGNAIPNTNMNMGNTTYPNTGNSNVANNNQDLWRL